MRGLRISQLAGRTGVPVTTLRFYESAGLLPADRTAAGYRVYGEESVDRLGFIASAKALGLPLAEIRDLLGVWEQGVCATVRARLLRLVADRIADTDHRTAELVAFAARLAEAHEQLSGPAPVADCGPDCGCTTSADGPPVACTLDSARIGDRTAQWHRLTQRAGDRADIPGGVRLSFPATPELAAEIAALAAAEQDCCAFFDFTLHLTPTAVELTVRAPDTAKTLLAQLFPSIPA
jgi:DNA-binding transcriptional MerR regulator